MHLNSKFSNDDSVVVINEWCITCGGCDGCDGCRGCRGTTGDGEFEG